jgi:predicted RNase H-like HicB family nuclease
MQYQVFVQNPADRTFLASVIGLPNLTANGITEQEAIDRLKSILDAQFKHGKLVTIDIDVPSDRWHSLSSGESPATNDPWITNMGIFQDDLTFDDFLAEVNAYRNAIDSAETHQ